MRHPNNFELFDQQVERFLKNQMTKEEELAFKNELSNDSEKLSRAQIIALMVEQMKYQGKTSDKEIIAAIKNTDIDILKTIVVRNKSIFSTILRYKDKLMEALMRLVHKPKPFPPLVQPQLVTSAEQHSGRMMLTCEADTTRTKMPIIDIRLKWLIGIAASVLILFGIGISMYQYDIRQTKNWGNAYGEFFCDASLITRSASDSLAIEKLSSTFKHIQTGDSLAVAIDFLRNVYDGYLTEEYANYEDYDNYIAWNLSIAYLKTGNKKKAKPILNKLVNDYPNTPIAIKTKELLEKLE